MSESDTAITIPHQATVEATVNAPSSVQLYHQDGRTLQVPEADVERWLRDGFSREPMDIPSLAEELDHLFASALQAAHTYATNVQEAKVIAKGETSDLAVLERALADLAQCVGNLVRAAHARYPAAQDTPVTLDHPHGGTLDVDPTQADHYRDGLAAYAAYMDAHPELDRTHPEHHFKAVLIPLYKSGS